MCPAVIDVETPTELRVIVEDRISRISNRSPLKDQGNLTDFILVYQQSKLTPLQNEYREVFERKLSENGLILNYHFSGRPENDFVFINIRVPGETLCRVAERNRLQMPIQRSDVPDLDSDKLSLLTFAEKIVDKLCWNHNPATIKSRFAPRIRPIYFYMEFSLSKADEFIRLEGERELFSGIQRSRIVWDIMNRSVVKAEDLRGNLLNGHHKKDCAALHFLLQNAVYRAVFPLHDSDVSENLKRRDAPEARSGSMRKWLYNVWARPGRWYKFQPLDEIRAYFGEQVGMYFAWLGLYVTMLFPFACVGLTWFCCTVLYRIRQFPSVSTDICEGSFRDEAFCAPCAFNYCKNPTKNFSSYCVYAKTQDTLVSTGTVVFSVLSCVWGIVFLEISKRFQARLACNWGTLDFHQEMEPPRTQISQIVGKTWRKHPITNEWERTVSLWFKSMGFLRSLTFVTFFICLVLAAILGIIVYRVTILVQLEKWEDRNKEFMTSSILHFGSSIVTSLTASIISAISMIIFQKIYLRVAYYLTEKEYPHTTSDFENSYTLKVYAFQFVNCYGALFYLAFVQEHLNLHTARHWVLDQCSPTGCTLAVIIQLCVVLVVKFCLMNIFEFSKPAIQKHILFKSDSFRNAETRQEKDFLLPELPELCLVEEYLELVLQYGFVVMFGAIFPLAPLIALISNIAEIRVDAFKFTFSKRVVPKRAANIGNWHKILEFVTKLSILTNALIIAFSTNLVDRFVYVSYFSPDASLEGFMNFSMQAVSLDVLNETKTCYCKRTFFSHDQKNRLRISPNQAIVLCAKVLFVLLFQNTLLWVQSAIQTLIPDVPEAVTLHQLRNRHIIGEILDRNRRLFGRTNE